MSQPDRARRRATYEVVDPLARTLEVLRLEGTRWVILATAGGHAAVRAEPFDLLEIELSQL